MKKNSFILFCLLFCTLLISSCKKDEAPDNDYAAALDDANAEFVFDDAASISDEAVYEIGGTYDGVLSASCVTVTWDTINSTDEDTLTINFGTSDCTCIDNVNRKGKLLITYIGNYTDSAVSHKITFSNYYFNGERLIGSYTILNNGHDSISGHLKLTGNSSGSVILTSGGQVNWACVNHFELLSGESTASILDNNYTITGDSHGSQSIGLPFLSQISTPLTRSLSTICRRYFTQGVIQVKPNEKDIRVIDFGIGACDNAASITLGGIIYSVILP